MKKFKYTALNKNYQKQEGFIDANDEAKARDALHKLNLSILMIHEANADDKVETPTSTKPQPEKNKPSITSPAQPTKTEKKRLIHYYFTGIDSNNKKVDGTIEAFDRFKAYKRLIKEFKFEIQSLYQNNLNKAEKKKWEAKGIEDLKVQLNTKQAQKKGNFFGLFNKPTPETKSSAINMDDLAETQIEAESQKLQKSIDSLIKTAEKVQEKYTENLPVEYLTKLKYTIDRLSVLKMSNNFANIRNISQELVDLLSPQDSTHPLFANKNEINTILETEDLSENPDFSKAATSLSSTKNSINGLTEKLENFLESGKKQVSESTLFSSIINKFKGRTDPELAEPQKAKKRALQKIFYLLRIYWTKKSPPEKAKIKTDIKHSWLLYRQNALLIKHYKLSHRESYNQTIGEIETFINWLLGFYIAYIFIAKLLLNKDLIPIEYSFIWSPLKTPLLIYIVLSLIIFKLAVHLKLRYFSKSILAGSILGSLSIVSISFIIANF